MTIGLLSYQFESELGLSDLFRSFASPPAFKGFECFSRGRDALDAIVRDLDIPPKSRVLLPALACEEVYIPFIRAGLRPVYYNVNDDLSADPDIVLPPRERPKVVLLINYFGFRQPESVVAEFRRRGIIVIEDGSHSWLGDYRTPYGDYYFASLRKLIPVPDGAIAWKREGDLLRSRSAKKQFALMYFRYTRLAGMLLLSRKNHFLQGLQRWTIRELFSAAERGCRSFTGPMPMMHLSLAVAASLNLGRIGHARRKNFSAFSEALPNQFKPVVWLTSDVIPFGFPTRIKQRALWQNALAHLGIQAAPLWNMSNLISTPDLPCKTLSEELLILPLGQDYSLEDVTNVVSRIKTLL